MRKSYQIFEELLLGRVSKKSFYLSIESLRLQNSGTTKTSFPKCFRASSQKFFGILSNYFEMWAKTASYVSRKEFWVFVSEYIFSLITIFGIWAQILGLLVNLVGGVIEVPSFVSGRVFWEKRFTWRRFIISWIFLEPWRKIFRVWAWFVSQKEQLSCPEKRCEDKQIFFRD